MTTMTITDNSDGIGLVAMFHAALLAEQSDMVVELASKSMADLPPLTDEEKRERSWDEELMK